MHELSICQTLISSVTRIAEENDAAAVDRIEIEVGPLSGVEPPLLQSAFVVACAGTVAEHAELVVTSSPVVVECRNCGTRGSAEINRLLCPGCGGWHVRVVEGTELMLLRVELSGIPCAA